MKKPVITLLHVKNLFILSSVLVLLCGCSAPPADPAPDPAVFTKSAAEITWNITTDPLLLENESPSPEMLSILFGAQIAVDEINASGGINGTLIAFCVNDTVSDFCLSYTDASVECRAVQDGLLSISITDRSLSEDQSADSKRQAFYDKYQKMYASEPNFYAIAAYDCMYQLKQFLEQETVSLPIE